MKRLLLYALNKDNTLVNVESVENGDKCGCVCPGCGMPLCAKNEGTHNIKHFAHQSGVECDYGYESALHLLAKQIISEEKCLTLPAEKVIHQPPTKVHFREVHEEKWDEILGIKPDIDATSEDGERFLIEIYNSHKVDENKRSKIVENNLKCIEIDVRNQILDKNSLRKFLIDSPNSREWITKETPNPFTRAKKPKVVDENKQKVLDHIKDLFNANKLKFKYTQHCECIQKKVCPWYESCYDRQTCYELVRERFGYTDLEEDAKFTDINGNSFKADLLLTSKTRKSALPIIISVRKQRRDMYWVDIFGAYLIDICIKDDNFVKDFLRYDFIEIKKDESVGLGSTEYFNSNIKIKPGYKQLTSNKLCVIKKRNGTVIWGKTKCTEMDIMDDDSVYKMTFMMSEEYTEAYNSYNKAFELANQLGRNLDMGYAPPKLTSPDDNVTIKIYHEKLVKDNGSSVSSGI